MINVADLPGQANRARELVLNNNRLAKWVSGCSGWCGAAAPHDLLPEHLRQLVQDSLTGLGPEVIDTHVHAISTDHVNRRTYNRVLEYALVGDDHEVGGVVTTKPQHNNMIRDHMADWIAGMRPIQYKIFLFAFTSTYNRDTGQEDLDRTGFKVSNEYLETLIQDLKKRGIESVAVHSIHPYDGQMKAKFMKFKPKFLKLLPNSMGVSMADKDGCRAFFQLVRDFGSKLIVHVGDEHSVSLGSCPPDNGQSGDPEEYRYWLSRDPNLQIIFAHVGSCGVGNFAKVLRLMKDFPAQTWADISCLCMTRRAKHMRELLQQPTDLLERVLYGTDYPLVNIRLFLHLSLIELVLRRCLKPRVAWRIAQLHAHNPLLASLCMFRNIECEGKKLPVSVFAENARKLLHD